MKKAFTVIELVFVIVMVGIMAAVSVMYIPQTNLQQASDYLIQNLKYTKLLAQTDDRFYTMSDGAVPNSVDVSKQTQYWQAGMWQLQFHRIGDNTQNSYSVYADTARSNATTNFDGRPMSGDLIAKDPDNKACLTGYSLSNRPTECENNVAKEVKLEETYGVTIDKIEHQGNCTESQTARIYFNKEGLPFCGSSKSGTQIPERLSESFKIVLKRKNQTATICVSPGGLIYGSSSGNCDKT